MKKLIIAVILILAPIYIPLAMAAGGQNVPNHQQWKRVEQWHKNHNDRFKAIEEEVAMSFKNSEFEGRGNPSLRPDRKK